MNVRYSVNLVRRIRIEEQRALRLKNRIFMLAASCTGLLVIAILVLVSQFLAMRIKIDVEKQQLNRIETEYRKYRATRMVVDRADIERLDALQANRIFWTKKLAALAYHLPENYWITRFAFDGRSLAVSGFGYISLQQEQLITLDNYLNKLRADSTYRDVFANTHFNAVARSDEADRSRVSFDFSSLR